MGGLDDDVWTGKVVLLSKIHTVYNLCCWKSITKITQKLVH